MTDIDGLLKGKPKRNPPKRRPFVEAPPPQAQAEHDMLAWLMEHHVEVRDNAGNIIAMWYPRTDPLLVRATILAAMSRKPR